MKKINVKQLLKSIKLPKVYNKKKLIKAIIIITAPVALALTLFLNRDGILLKSNQIFSQWNAEAAENAFSKYQTEAKETAKTAALEAIDDSDVSVNEDGTITINTKSKNVSVNGDGTITFTDEKSASKLIELKEDAENKAQSAKIYEESKSMTEANRQLAELYSIKADVAEENIPKIEQEIQADDSEQSVEAGEISYPNEPEKAEFLRQASEAAKIVAKGNGLLPSIMTAQAIIESAWGQSGLAVQDLNFFGVKYRGTGNYSEWPTTEYYDGVATTIVDKFQKYSTMEESFQSNADVLKTVSLDGGQTMYYQGAWLESVKDAEYPYKAAAAALQDHYATSPDYETTLITIIQRYGLNYLDSEVLSQN